MSYRHTLQQSRANAEARARTLVEALPGKWAFQLHRAAVCSEDPLTCLNEAQRATIADIELMHAALCGKLSDTISLTVRLRRAVWNRWFQLHPDDAATLLFAESRFVRFLTAFRNCCRQRRNRAKLCTHTKTMLNESSMHAPAPVATFIPSDQCASHVNKCCSDPVRQSVSPQQMAYSLDDDDINWDEDEINWDEDGICSDDWDHVFDRTTPPPEEPLDWGEWTYAP